LPAISPAVPDATPRSAAALPSTEAPPPARGMAAGIALLVGLSAVIGGAIIMLAPSGQPIYSSAPAAATTAAPSVKPTPTPARKQKPAAALPVIAGPTPAPPVAAVNPAVVWSAAKCQWATSTLRNDAQLDRQEAALIRSQGSDPRFPQATAADYDAYASHWDRVGYLVSDYCLISTAVPNGATPADCTDAIVWLDQAADNHDRDLSRAGASDYDHAWDRSWSQFYRALSADVGGSCGHD
jgi:hypothetical protein